MTISVRDLEGGTLREGVGGDKTWGRDDRVVGKG